MVCFEIVDLLSEYNSPEIFAEEFDYVEVVGEAWTVAGEPVDEGGVRWDVFEGRVCKRGSITQRLKVPPAKSREPYLPLSQSLSDSISQTI